MDLDFGMGEGGMICARMIKGAANRKAEPSDLAREREVFAGGVNAAGRMREGSMGMGSRVDQGGRQ